MGKIFARAGALVMALLFLVTSLALTIGVIWQATHKKDDTIPQQQAMQDNPNQLKGKPLADFKPVGTVTKLQTIDTKTGNGTAVKSTDTITVNYTGAIAATGKVFESSLDSGQPATFPLNQVIKGWTEGIPGMKVGGTRRLIIPAELAYGSTPPTAAIPPNAALVFDVTLLKINN